MRDFAPVQAEQHVGVRAADGAGELQELFAIPFERNLVHVVYLCALGTTLLVLRPTPPTSRT
jgi:hypothetical protein